MRRMFLLLAALVAQAQSFEVASVRPHPPAVDRPVIKKPDANPLHVSGNRVTLEMIGLKGLIMAAYNVKEYQVFGGPPWMSRLDSFYDVEAKTPGNAPASMDQVRLMLRALLSERFHLKLQRESKQLPVYNLVIAKGRPRLQKVTDSPPAPGMRQGTMDQLAALLSLMLDRPVIDKTGLTGIYEYSNALALLDSGSQDSADTISKTLTAIQEQLGLRAQAAKANLDILVIGSADPPSAD